MNARAWDPSNRPGAPKENGRSTVCQEEDDNPGMSDEATRPDREAWVREALTGFEAPLVRYATRLLRDAEAARDVVQDVFLRLCRQSPASLDGRLREWLFAVCRNRAIDHLRKEGRMHPVANPVDPAAATDQPPPLRLLESAEQGDALADAVRALPARQQELVQLRFGAGLSYREIASVTSLSVGNVGYVLHMAMRALRTQLAEDVAAPAGKAHA